MFVDGMSVRGWYECSWMLLVFVHGISVELQLECSMWRYSKRTHSIVREHIL